VNGHVIVTQSPINPLVFTVVFSAGLLPAASPPPRIPGPLPLMTATGGNGAPNPVVSAASTWVNLTSATTTPRQSVPGQLGFPPNTPGPNDDFRISFGQTNVAWTDLSLVYVDDTVPPPPIGGLSIPVLYAALGTGGGVFRTDNPNLAPASFVPTTWYVGNQGAPANEVQQILVSPWQNGGTYQLRFNGSALTPGLPGLPANTDSNVGLGGIATTIQALLNGLPTIGGVGGSVTVTLDPTSDANNLRFDVVFGGAMANTQEPLIQAVSTNPPQVTVTETQKGAGTDTRSGNEFPVGNYSNIKIDSFPASASTFNNVTLYAAVANAAPAASLNNVYVSTDGGLDWAPVKGTPPNFTASQGNYDLALVMMNPSVVFVGGQEASNSTHLQQLFGTTDGGNTWTDLFQTAGNIGPHTSQHALDLDGLGRLVVGGDGGVWRLDFTNNQWTDITGNLAIAEFNTVAGHPTNLDVAYGASRFNGVEGFNANLAWTAIDNQDGGQVAVDPKRPNLVYYTQGSSFLLPPGGLLKRFNALAPGVPPTTLLNLGLANRYVAVSLDSVNTSRLLVGTVGGLLEILNADTATGPGALNSRSLGGLGNITSIGLGMFQGTFQPDSGFPLVTDKGASTYDPDTIYVTDGTNISVTKNHGLTWTPLSGPGNRDLPGGLGNISDVEVDPTNRDVVYASRNVFTGGAGRQVFKTTDAGQTWTDITSTLPDVPVWKLVLDPRSGDLYAGTDRGVYVLPAGSGTWRRFGTGLANVQVKDLELNQTSNTLLAGTYGRSMYELFLDDGRPNAGALRAVSGSAVWTGTVQLVGDLANNTVSVGANGSQAVLNGVTPASLNILGTISDQTPGTNPLLVKRGLGDVIFSGANLYGGVTEVREGQLVVRNPQALGQAGPTQNTVVDDGAALVLETDLQLEPILLHGAGIQPPFNAHNTGALRNLVNNNTYTGQLTLASDAVIGVDSGTTLTIGAKPGLLGAGKISDDDPGNAWKLTKELTGTLILASANDYKGKTAVYQGALRVMDAAALGLGDGTAASGTEVLDGAQLQMASPAGTSVTVPNEALSLSGTGIAGTGALLNTGGSTTWQGPISLTSDPGFSASTFPAGAVAFGVANAGDTLTLDTVISEALVGGIPLPSGVSKVGPGTLVLTKANTYSGGTYVHSGVVRIQNGNALGVPNTNEVQRVTVTGPAGSTFTLSFNGQVTGSLAVNATAAAVQSALANLSNIGGGNVAVTKQTVTSAGPTPITFNLYTVTFQGALAGLAQPLMLASSQGGASAVVSPVAEGQTGTIVYNDDPINGPGAVEIDGDPNHTGASITVPSESIGLNGTGIGGAGALRNVSGNNTWQGPVVLMTNDAIGVDPGTTLTVTGEVEDFVPVPVPAASLTKVGTGTLVFPGSNAYSGKTFVNAGVLNIQDPGALGLSGPEVQTVTVTGPGGTFFLKFNGQTTNALDILSPTLASDIQNALDGLSTIGANNVTVKQGTGPNTNVYSITFDNPVAPGTGALRLDNQNPITVVNPSAGVTAVMATVRDGPEGTVVNSGATLQTQGDLLMTTEALTLNGPGFNNAGALEDVSGNTTWDRPITLGSSSSVGVDRAGDTLTIDKSIGQSAAGSGLTKVGPGILNYAGGPGTDNTYTGLTQVNQGTLLLNKTGGAVAVAGDLTIGDGVDGLAVARWVQSNQVVDTATVTVKSDGTMDLGGQAETVAVLRVRDGQVMTGAGGVLTTGLLDMAGGTVTIGAGGQVALTGNVTATSSAQGKALVTGPGTLSLGSATRDFTVSAGAQAIDLDVASAITGTGAAGINKRGTGRLELDAANTYAGQTQIFQGDVQVDGSVGGVQLAGGTLSGHGTVGAVNSPASPAVGTVAPGDNPGTGVLHVGNTVWGAGTTFSVELNSPAAGTGYDQLQVAGNIDVTGANLVPIIGPAVTAGQSFTIIHATGTVTGQFAQGTVMFIAGMKYTIAYSTHDVIINPVLASTTLTVFSSANPAVYGAPLVYTASLKSESGAAGISPADSVTFTLDGTDYTVPVGTGTITFDPQAAMPAPS
jgi:autotransporter-associated beta strand protein